MEMYDQRVAGYIYLEQRRNEAGMAVTSYIFGVMLRFSSGVWG